MKFFFFSLLSFFNSKVLFFIDFSFLMKLLLLSEIFKFCLLVFLFRSKKNVEIGIFDLFKLKLLLFCKIFLLNSILFKFL